MELIVGFNLLFYSHCTSYTITYCRLTPLLHGKQCGGPCAKNCGEKQDCNALL